MVFMDMNMPAMDGQKTLARVRDMETISGFVPGVIVLHSAIANLGDISGLAADFDDVVSKPIKLSNLRKVL